MKKINAFLFLFLLSPLSFADGLELNIFSNGQVADADEVNENFQLLETALNSLQGDSACATAADVVCPTPSSFDITVYNQGVSDGFSSGVSSVDITTDNQSSYDDGFSAGVTSVDITTDNQSSYDDGFSAGVASSGSMSFPEVLTGYTSECCNSLGFEAFMEVSACEQIMMFGETTQCPADQLTIGSYCSLETSEYFCGGRIESCDGSGCDAVRDCEANDFECQFTINGVGSLFCGTGSTCTVITPESGSFRCGYGADCTIAGLNGGTVTCAADSECEGNASSGVLDCKPGSTCSGETSVGTDSLTVNCASGATCTGKASAGSAATTMYCESGARCIGKASAGNSHTTMICAAGSDCSGGPSAGNSCLLYTSPSPRDLSTSRMPSSA